MKVWKFFVLLLGIVLVFAFTLTGCPIEHDVFHDSDEEDEHGDWDDDDWEDYFSSAWELDLGDVLVTIG